MKKKMTAIEVFENPYRQGYSHELFEYWGKQRNGSTKAELREWLMKEFGLSRTAACATVTTVLSPRLKSKRGDARGNRSARGETYYAEKLRRKVQFGVRDPQRFLRRRRLVALIPRGKSNYTPVTQINVKATTPRELKRQMKVLSAQLKALQREVEAQ